MKTIEVTTSTLLIGSVVHSRGDQVDIADDRHAARLVSLGAACWPVASALEPSATQKEARPDAKRGRHLSTADMRATLAAAERADAVAV